MTRMSFSRVVFGAWVSGLLAGTTVAAQSPGALSVEWIYSDDGARVGKVPEHLWLDDSTLLLYDTGRLPSNGRSSGWIRRPARDGRRSTWPGRWPA